MVTGTLVGGTTGAVVSGALVGDTTGAVVAGDVFFFMTVILHTAFTFLLLLLTAVIFAVPFFFAVTFPLAVTVAIFLLEVFHVTAADALAGVTFFTFKVTFCPTYNFLLVAFNLIAVAFFAAACVLTGQTARLPTDNANTNPTAAILFCCFFIKNSSFLFLHYNK